MHSYLYDKVIVYFAQALSALSCAIKKGDRNMKRQATGTAFITKVAEDDFNVKVVYPEGAFEVDHTRFVYEAKENVFVADGTEFSNVGFLVFGF
jgi:hypothetical protein